MRANEDMECRRGSGMVFSVRYRSVLGVNSASFKDLDSVATYILDLRSRGCSEEVVSVPSEGNKICSICEYWY